MDRGESLVFTSSYSLLLFEFFKFVFSFHPIKLKSFHFLLLLRHNPVVPPPILAIYHYEMEEIFNLSDFTES